MAPGVLHVMCGGSPDVDALQGAAVANPASVLWPQMEVAVEEDMKNYEEGE